LEGDITVDLGPGVHAPFTLDARDSGTVNARVVYQGSSAPDAPQTVVSAGVEVPPHLCKERLKTASDPVVVCDLSSLELNQTTTLGFRASAVSFGGAPTILARYPNVGNGSVWNGTYQWLYADLGGNSSFSLNSSNPDAKRVASWASTSGAMIQGYFVWDWNDAFTAIVGGGENPDGSTTIKVDHAGAIKPLARFIGMNMLAELDAPNEVFIDARQEKLYFYPPTPLAQWGPSEQLVISKNATAIALDGVTDVTLKDMTVLAAASGGITATGVNRTHIVNCNVHACGGTGIHLSGYDSAVEACEVYGVGGAGVHVGGGDVPTLTPGNNTVRACNIHHYSLWKRTCESTAVQH
jgi:hypothetical protein